MSNAPDPAVGETHPVFNVATELENFNMFTTDAPLLEATAREGAAWGLDELTTFGNLTGSAHYLSLGHLANKYKPELFTHDRFGRRIDIVEYHDAYHELMRSASEHGIHARPWSDPKPGAFVARAAQMMLQAQVEAGHGCPMTMTFASVPTIRAQPDVAEQWEPLVLAQAYDPSDRPAHQKGSAKIGMGMTEKQGGSDVRANTTTAKPLGRPGPGELYRIDGHKWFMSAPMCDAFLVLAQTDAGLGCFLLPRWLPDGRKNGLKFIRLKNKMGNVSNASSEVEFRSAQGWLLGPEGRGVPTIIEMVNLTRFDCLAASAAQMRMALAQATHLCEQRAAFGDKLIDKPLMQNVLTDMSLEYEAACALALRMARALDQRASDASEALLSRIGMAVGKYWVCKRGPHFAYEAMECIGGSGVVEESMMPRLYREAVINPIWEGSGNVQCLDVLRAVHKSPEVLDALFAEIETANGSDSDLDQFVGQLKSDMRDQEELEFRARDLVDRMALAFQASLLVRHAPDPVATAYCATRLNRAGRINFGTLPKGTPTRAILERTHPGVEKHVPAPV